MDSCCKKARTHIFKDLRHAIFIDVYKTVKNSETPAKLVTSGLSHSAVLSKGAEKGVAFKNIFCCFISDLPGRLKKALLLWPVTEFTWRIIPSINRLLNNFALVSLCIMIHPCKIAILVKEFQRGYCLSQDQRKSNWITFATVSKVRKRSRDLLKQWLDCVWVLPLPMALPPTWKIAVRMVVSQVVLIKQINKNL